MSDGAYRDDHDAALARVAALEQELETARADHERVVALERELAKVRAERDRLRGLLPDVVVTPPAVVASPDPEVEAKDRGNAVAVLAGVAALAIAIVMAIVVSRSSNDEPAGHDDLEQTARDRAASEHMLAECLDWAVGATAEEATNSYYASLYDRDSGCAKALDVAAEDPRLTPVAHDGVVGMKEAMGRLIDVRSQILEAGSSEPSDSLRNELGTALAHLHTAASALQVHVVELREVTQ